jgi:tRNA A-37 threonylcarbamoyl transferase component Bud32
VKRPWEKQLPVVILVTLCLLAAQFVYSRRDLKTGELYIHTSPSGALIFMTQAGSIAGVNKKLLARSPGPLPINIKERTRFTFNIELWGFQDKRIYVTREELSSGPTYTLEPRWPFSWFFYHLRDYAFLWMASLFALSFWFVRVRPQKRNKQEQESLWVSGRPQTGMRFHEYRLLELLGEGAAGAVYRADKPGENKQESYTLKLFHRGDKKDEELEATLRREFKNCAALSHPNIVYLLDWGVYRGYYYLVSEFIEGTPLDEVSDLTLLDLCLWGRQLTGALAYAHSQGVVHRDIKPANIMRTTDNTVKILDFGIAARKDEEESGAGSIGYMAPEQAGGKVTPAGDFYSLGVTIYRLASGRMPFPGDDYFQVLAAQVTGNYDSLAELAPDCPEPLNELIAGLLEKEAENRLQDPEQIRLMFEEAATILSR